MSTPTNAVTLSVLLLLSLSHLFLLSHSVQDPSTTVAVSASEFGSESDSFPAVDLKDEPHQAVIFHPSESDRPVDLKEEPHQTVVSHPSESDRPVDLKDEPHQTVVFHPSESDGPVDPDLIAHSFRLPNHRHPHHHQHRHFHHGLGCGGGGHRRPIGDGHRRPIGDGHRRPIGDGTIRLPSMQRGPGVGRGPFVEIAAEDFEQMKKGRKEKKWMKRERKDDDDSDRDDDDEHEFEHEMKRMRREGNWGFMDRVRHFVNHF